MRILHVLDHSLPLHSGYTFRTRAILKAQIAHGWTVAGVTSPRQGAHEAACERVDGLDFYRTPAPAKKRIGISEWQEVKAFARRIDSVIEAFRPDILHAHSPVLNAMAAERAAKRHGLPLLYEIRAFWEDAAVGSGTGREGSAKYRLTHALETRAVRRADAVAVICEGLRDDLISRGIDGSKIMISPNGVDMDLFGDPVPYDAALARELGLEGAEVLGFIGSFYEYEGLDDLIAAMPTLIERRPDAHLLLVGGGFEDEALRRAARESGVGDNIHFTGRVDHDQVERYYSLIDILVYPRKRMRLTDLVTPLKPLEAMAQRRLVAASDVGGHRELIVDGETGTLFPPGKPKAIARALAGMLDNRGMWEARRTRARDFVEADRNWSLNVSRYQPVYQSLLKSSHREVSS